MTTRLTAQDWLDFALRSLAREGFDVLKADVMARLLGVSRGSFYWHFADLRDFHSRIIDQWRERATEAIITDIERHEAPRPRLEALLRHAFGDGAILDVRIRAWADVNAAAAEAVAQVDLRRQDYIERLLVKAGIAPTLAATRTRLLYWTFLGAAHSPAKPSGDELARIVAELIRFALPALE